MKFPLFLKRLPWFELFIVVALLGIQGYAAFSDAYNFPNKWFTRDDAYYYFKVAQNISEGKGSTFDGLNPTNGYHPLWLLVCVPVFALARFDLILPLRILLLGLGLLRAATAILLYRLLKKGLSPPVAALAALYWAFDLNLHWNMYQQGLETGLAAFCLVLALFLFQRFERDRRTAPVKWTQLATLAFVAVLLTFSRLDLAFLALILGLWIVFRGHPLRSLLPLDLLSLTTSALGAFVIRTGLPEYYTYADSAILMLVVSVSVRVPLFYFLGLYEHPKFLKPLRLAWRALIGVGGSALAILALLLGLFHLGVLEGSFPRTVPLIDGGLTFVLLLVSRCLYAIFSSARKEAAGSTPWQTLQMHWRKWLADGFVYYGILGGALGAYMLWNKLAFGVASPVSGQIKRWWGSFSSRVYGGAARYPTTFFGIDANGDLNAWAPVSNLVGQWNDQIEMRVIPLDYGLRYALMLLVLLVGLLLLLSINRRRAARGVQELALIPLLAGSFLQVLSYSATGYAAAKEWYWIIQPVFIVLAGSLLLDILTQPARRHFPMTGVILFLMALYWGLTRAIFFGQITAAQMTYGEIDAQPPYMEVAAFVENHTEPGSLVGMTGGGNVGYFIRERTIINMDGLINSYAYFQAHKAHRGSDYLAALGMDYIFANPTFLEAMPYRGQYTGRYEVLDYYGGKAIMRFLPNHR
ncbi:MAG: hypothetical protein ACOYYU_21325 [Chloroflexota bacterium]